MVAGISHGYKGYRVMCFIKNEQAVWGIWYEAKNTVAFFRAEVSIVIMVDCFDTDVQRTKDVGHVATAPLLDLRPNIFSAPGFMKKIFA